MPPKYGLVWPSTSILGSWNSHWKYVELKMKMMKDGHELQETVDIWFQWFVFKFISLLSKASNHKHASRPALCTLRFHLCEKYAVQLRAAGSSWFITGGMNIHTYPYSKFRILPRVYSSGVLIQAPRRSGAFFRSCISWSSCWRVFPIGRTSFTWATHTALTTRRMWNCWSGRRWFLCFPRAMREDIIIQYPLFLCFSGVHEEDISGGAYCWWSTTARITSRFWSAWAA